MKKFDQPLIKSLLVDLIEYQTENPGGITKEICDYLRDWSTEQGIKSKIYEYVKDDIKLHNIVMTIGTGSKKKIVLSGHLDTVPAGDHAEWDDHPFAGVEKDGKIYGRGSADMKGGVAGLLATMLMLQDENDLLDNYQIVFAGTADEETDMSGSANLKEIGIMDDAICLVIPEATNLRVGIAEKGVFWGKITVHGKAAHGSMPDEGVNAIEGAVQLFPQLHQILDPKLTNEWLGRSTLNIGTIIGGNKINVVPDTCIFQTDYRLIPEEYDKFEQKLREKLAEFTSYKTSIDVVHKLIPIQSDLNHAFIQNLLNLLKETKPIGVTYGTDGVNLIDQSPSTIPFVIYGPGDPTIIHKVNEHIVFADIEKFSQTLAVNIIKTYSTKNE
ncbi:MAG: M20 family metallopeptidase [Candidatus Hodarchaeales archaeon]|jgi:succinyl-diaminopimelate desuccinylase